MSEERGQQAVEEERDLAAELASMEDRWKRARADLENYRKRSERELQRRSRENDEAVLREWLEVVDSVERALLLAETDSPLAIGLLAVRDQIDAVLERQGVSRIGEKGEPFDPERHEAISVIDSEEVDRDTVAEVARSGYALGDRVLRPAQVLVARPKERED